MGRAAGPTNPPGRGVNVARRENGAFRSPPLAPLPAVVVLVAIYAGQPGYPWPAPTVGSWLCLRKAAGPIPSTAHDTYIIPPSALSPQPPALSPGSRKVQCVITGQRPRDGHPIGPPTGRKQCCRVSLSLSLSLYLYLSPSPSPSPSFHIRRPAQMGARIRASKASVDPSGTSDSSQNPGAPPSTLGHTQHMHECEGARCHQMHAPLNGQTSISRPQKLLPLYCYTLLDFVSFRPLFTGQGSSAPASPLT
ncbi:hypothetical protein K431DRAFT_1524 [Polychaeton citri CBS 116435]|uniref:Uncharacterized protein n=1 Tax=Polychaeton citri CBS 116435 TaxID=1314669 RepID=A0A9P4QID4_9PEZI|nr:hypothetical protein K431DRAFT_1524 [Polychaeton citri CBS 116435]